MAQGTQPATVTTLRGGMRGGEGMEGVDVCIIMTDSRVVQQRPTQHCEAIFHQLKFKKI